MKWESKILLKVRAGLARSFCVNLLDWVWEMSHQRPGTSGPRGVFSWIRPCSLSGGAHGRGGAPTGASVSEPVIQQTIMRCWSGHSTFHRTVDSISEWSTLESSWRLPGTARLFRLCTRSSGRRTWVSFRRGLSPTWLRPFWARPGSINSGGNGSIQQF